MKLEGDLIKYEQLRANLKLCLKTEELIKSSTLTLQNGTGLTLSKLNKTKEEFYHVIGFKIDELELPVSESEFMCGHLLMHQLVNRTITKLELDILFDFQYEIDSCFKNYIWNHNIKCLICFMRDYQDIFNTILSLKTGNFYYKLVIGTVNWINERLNQFQQVRSNFPFCAICDYNSSKLCSFWTGVSTQLATIISTPNQKQISNMVDDYIQLLKIECNCPTTLEDLKKI